MIAMAFSILLLAFLFGMLCGSLAARLFRD